jgi:hypothetical protein
MRRGREVATPMVGEKKLSEHRDRTLSERRFLLEQRLEMTLRFKLDMARSSQE